MSKRTKIDPVMLCEAMEALVDLRRRERDRIVDLACEGVSFDGELATAQQRLGDAQAALDSVWIKPRDRGSSGIMMA